MQIPAYRLNDSFWKNDELCVVLSAMILSEQNYQRNVIFKQHNQIYCIFSSILAGLSDFFNVILVWYFPINFVKIILRKKFFNEIQQGEIKLKKAITSILVAFALFLSAFITSSAMAGGFAIGIIGATGKVDTSGSETEGTGSADGKGTADKEKNTTSVQESLTYGSIFAEYSFGEMYGMTLGVSYTPMDRSLGTKSRTDTQSTYEEKDTNGSNDSGTYTAKADISNHATIYIEPTFMPTDNFGLYLKGGVSRVVVNALESITFGEDSSAYGNETVLGGMLGLGAKVVHDSGLMFKLEYTKTIYETVKMTSTTGNKNIISADPEIEAFRLAIGYQF